MKNFSKIAIAGVVFALASISTASAQSMRISVPFGFHAGNQMLPAGEYKVDLNQQNQRITLNNISSRRSYFLIVKAYSGSTDSDRASLVFNRYGENYFLTRVNTTGVARGAALFEGRAEREIAKTRASVKPEIVLASGR